MTRVALVTGGARGIGRAIALDLAHDHQVAITWRDTRPDGLPASIAAIRADLTDACACRTIIAEVIRRFGGLDVIVNNAGLVASTPVDKFAADAARAILDVNLIAPGELLAAALEYLKPGAAIVNISSINAVLPPKDASIYGASKAALNLWTRAMAKELGDRGIRINAVAPGAINIPEDPRPPDLTQQFVQQTALGRIGTPDDVARAVRFLASDQAGFITGEVLAVSGGYRL
ncbi:SDR family NAD(P)-dependent oxidoreductase [Sedimentitalea nanhaiensis]|uniref:3-oxoacyl-[acyl-carrier protein] reductase n=1 Tax=Sedimentitalea nanhaiensis TaxID=999627 RepID=A0A1I6YVU5_9RHOB|nr:SDR family oxidoreductase [Sedimentitalea nanhaiensis]SFT54582.1 3-oxoacyl-[acyl-carrier protein] reductase [Sedimentitalea nanhaiensis]